jgi:predicted CoA-binding protein
MSNKQNVLIVGASEKPDRYANKAMKALLEKGHEVVLLNPRLSTIDGRQVYQVPAAVKETIDTITVYVGPDKIAGLADELIKLKPQRVIFNPGSESEIAISQFSDNGIKVIRGCTLVMLATGQF